MKDSPLRKNTKLCNVVGEIIEWKFYCVQCDRKVVVYSTDALSNSKFRSASHHLKWRPILPLFNSLWVTLLNTYYLLLYYSSFFFDLCYISYFLGRLLPCYKFFICLHVFILFPFCFFLSCYIPLTKQYTSFFIRFSFQLSFNLF